MSVTFWCPKAPSTKVQPYPDEPDFIVDRSDLPEINVSNHNARALLAALGYDDQTCADAAGTVPAQELDAFIARIDRALTHPEYIAPVLEPAMASLSQRRVQREIEGKEPPVLTQELECVGPGQSQLAQALVARIKAESQAQQAKPRLSGFQAQFACLYFNESDEPVVTQTTKAGPSMFMPARTHEYIEHRLNDLKNLAQQAKAKGWDISWG